MTPHPCRVVEVAPEATLPLRAALLRADRPDLDLRLPEDDLAGTFHLGALDGAGQVVGVATLVPSTPDVPVRCPAYRLRQMAVAPTHQGQGVGSALLGAAVAGLRSRGVATLWAESRDSALAFYLSQGLRALPGRRHRVGDVGYTDVVLDLDEASPTTSRP